MFFLGSIILTNLYIFFYGKIIRSFFFKNEQISNPEIGIFGSIFLSFLALSINFFFPLTPIICTIIFIVPIFFLFKKNFLVKKDFIFILFSSFLTILILAYSKVNTPDAGLYHLPYIQILNENKIILGLGNIHFRFAHVSILQYLSAINYNYIFGVNGILIPLASLVIFLLTYFLSECYIFTSKKISFSIKNFFNLGVLIYIAYKINRYSGFGNDAVAHLLFFYLISIFLSSKENFIHLYKSSLISVFIFLNKITLGLSFLFPLFIFLKIKKKHIKIFFSFPILFLVLWLIKNFLVSGCLIFPVEITCSKNIIWSNNNQVIKQSIAGEAWSKDWPNRKNFDIEQKEFIKDFNWIDAWLNKHFKYVLIIVTPFILFLIILIISINYFKTEKFQKFNFNKFDKQKIIFVFIVLILSNLVFFLKFPLYRYGYSYLISLVILLTSIFIFRFDQKYLHKLFRSLIVICLIIFCTKQLIRIERNFNSSDIWPGIYSFLPYKKDLDPKEIVLSNYFKIYIKNRECMYNKFSKSPCTNNFSEKLNHKITGTYDIIFIKN